MPSQFSGYERYLPFAYFKLLSDLFMERAVFRQLLDFEGSRYIYTSPPHSGCCAFFNVPVAGVLLRRSDPKMIRVNASPVVASVTDELAFGDRALEKLKRVAVRWLCPTSFAVPICRHSAPPIPAQRTIVGNLNLANKQQRATLPVVSAVVGARNEGLCFHTLDNERNCGFSQ